MYYGPMMIDIQGTSLTPEEGDLIKHPSIGGILLFRKNYINKETIKALISDIRKRAEHPLLIAVDHEGGRVWRFREGFTVLPPAREYGRLYDNDPEEAKALAEKNGYIMASELLSVGVDLSLAPVLDVDQDLSEVIGDRAFHHDPEVVTTLAEAFICGMSRAGMAATGKHFPGHGGSKADSHFKEVIDNRSLEALMNLDMVPFMKLNKVLKAIMPAYVIYPAVDSVVAGFSHIWLQDILRKKCGFEGAIISDCISMKGTAIGGDYVVRARMALDAGCDMVILSQQNTETQRWVLDKLDRTLGEASVRRLKELAGKFDCVLPKTADLAL